MNKEKIIEALEMGNIEWQKHALEFLKNISKVFKYFLLIISILIMTLQSINAESNDTIILDDGTVTNIPKYVNKYVKEHPIDIYSIYFKNATYKDILGYTFLLVLFIIYLVVILYWIFFEWTDFFYRFIVPVGLIFLAYYLSFQIIRFFYLNKSFTSLIFLVIYIIFIYLIEFLLVYYIRKKRDKKKKSNYFIL